MSYQCSHVILVYFAKIDCHGCRPTILLCWSWIFLVSYHGYIHVHVYIVLYSVICSVILYSVICSVILYSVICNKNFQNALLQWYNYKQYVSITQCIWCRSYMSKSLVHFWTKLLIYASALTTWTRLIDLDIVGDVMDGCGIWTPSIQQTRKAATKLVKYWAQHWTSVTDLLLSSPRGYKLNNSRVSQCTWPDVDMFFEELCQIIVFLSTGLSASRRFQRLFIYV